MSFLGSKSSSHDSSEKGLKSGISSLANIAGRYIQARSQLLMIEGSEAASFVGKRLIKGIIAALFLGIAYLLFLLIAIALGGHYLAENQDGILANWLGAATIAAVIHLLLGLIFLAKTRKANNKPLFEYTRSEWEKDQKWMQKQSSNKK